MLDLRRTNESRQISEAEDNHFHTVGLPTSCNIDSDRTEDSGLGVCPSLDDSLEQIRITDGMILELRSQLMFIMLMVMESLSSAQDLHLRILG